MNITRGASKGSIIQTVSSNASSSYSEIAAATSPGQTLFFQLYRSADDNLAAKRIQEVESLGYKAIFLTVDAVVAGRREVDIRSPWELDVIESGKQTYYSEQDDPNAVDDLGTSGALVGKDDQDMTWEKVFASFSVKPF